MSTTQPTVDADSTDKAKREQEDREYRHFISILRQGMDSAAMKQWLHDKQIAELPCKAE